MTAPLFYLPDDDSTMASGPPSERLWEFRKGQHTFTCDLLDLGPDGVEVQILRNGQRLYGRRFHDRERAIRFAASVRLTIARGRWIPE